MRAKAKKYEQKTSAKGGVFLSLHAPEKIGRSVLAYLKAKNEKDSVHKTTIKSLLCDAVVEYMTKHPV